jgi:ferredoxin
VVTGDLVSQPTSPSGPASNDAGRPVRIVVDRERCIGAGQCVLTEPSVFDQSDADGRVELLIDRPGPELLPDVREAVALCPGHALSLAGP